jgi:23S rRNA pseudouridine2605 synthase
VPKEEKIYIMLHKPEGYVTTVKDQFGRPTALDLLEGSGFARLYPVGRLDYDSSGLLLLTNDGELTYKLTHPKHDIDKVYVARVFGVPTQEDLANLRAGIEIDGKKTAPAGAELIKTEGAYASLKITLHEGRNRQVRKMCEAINHPVASLKRVATGKLFLGALKKGEYRKLTKREIEYLQGI